MSEASDRVREAAEDARSGDDLVSDPMASVPSFFGEEPLDSPLDRETLDEQSASGRMGGWESRRRDAS